MNTKLTLRMDESLIAAAKGYAAAHGSSVSEMVANYFAALRFHVADQARTAKLDAASEAAPPDNGPSDLRPVTRSLVGILKAKPGQSSVDEGDYHAYLERKYLTDEDAPQAGSSS